MKGLLSTHNNPAINLATEEYLLRHTQLDVFFLYTNSPSIIVGKHQNTLAEINYQYINENNIPVYRRLSGGGTVYHDDNNLNFCFIKSGKKGELVNFERYSEPILLALKKLGINATFGKRHDIQIEGKKVSGNASHVYKNRVMHHGTLLYNSDLSILNNSLKTNPLLIKDRAVKSVRSEVVNISNYLNPQLDYADFVKFVFKHLLSHYNNSDKYTLTNEEISEIKRISIDKYSTWEWNYGYSPNYSLNKDIKLENRNRVRCSLNVEKGIIKSCVLKTNYKEIQDELNNLSELLIKSQHDINSLNNILSTVKSGYFTDNLKLEILKVFFV